MQTIHIDQIVIPPERQRRSINADHIMNLREDFEQIGILNPIVLREEDGKPTLVAGECRYKAAKLYFQRRQALRHNKDLCPPGHIPFVWLSALSEKEIFQAELNENRYRLSLSVVDEAKALARYHELCRADDPAITDKQVLEQILPPDVTPQHAILRQAALIAKHSDMPEVQKAKTKAEAVRAIERKVMGEVNSILGAGTAASYTGTHTQHRGDAREILPTLPSESFECIITDPPYGVGADTFGSQQEQAHKYEDSFEYFSDLSAILAKESYRIAAPEAHAYVFCDPRQFVLLSTLFREAGWDVWKRPLIWHKAVGPAANVGLLPRPEHGPRNTYDCILFANKGDRKVTAVYPDVIPIPRLTQTGHPAEKPAELYRHLLSRSCFPGDRIIDPFAGGGPIFPAANALKLTATAINLHEEDFQLANTRLNEQM